MPWSREDLERYVDLQADVQGVDPRLARAVAEQESGFNPQARTSKGAYGVMQLMPGTAKQLGVNRDDPADNIRGGVMYLKQQHAAFGGDVPKTLAAYNAGPGAVQAHKGVPPYKETQAFVSRIMSKLGPASAEAAGLSAADRARLEELQADVARLEGKPAPAPQVPQDAPAPAEPQPDPSATPGMRFQGLPSITRMEPQTRIQRSQEFAGLNPALQEEFLRSEEPAPGGLAMGGGPVAQSQPVTDQAPLLAMGQKSPVWREGDPLPPDARRPPTPTEAPVTEGITAPSTMIPLLMPGAGIKAAAPLLAKVPTAVGHLVRPAAEGLSQTAGWTAGRTAETGRLPSAGDIGTEAALNIATGGVVELPSALRDAKNAALRATPGAQILLKQQAVQEAEGLGKRVFNAQDKAVVGKAFDAVAATGEKLDTSPVRALWQTLTPAEQRIAGNELSKISSTFADALKTKKLGDWDIGDLQHLRSELRKAGMTKRTPETQDLLQSMRSSVDEAIHNGMAKGSLPAAELIEAQKAYRKVMQAEDLQGLITKHTKDSPNLKWQEMNLAALNKSLRGGGTKKAKALVEGMDATERQGLQQELEGLSKKYPFIRMGPLVGNLASAGSLVYGATQLMSGNVVGAAGSLLPAIINAASRSPNVMGLFKKSILEGKGQLSPHHLDALITAIRHENEQP